MKLGCVDEEEVISTGSQSALKLKESWGRKCGKTTGLHKSILETGSKWPTHISLKAFSEDVWGNKHRSSAGWNVDVWGINIQLVHGFDKGVF